MDPERIKKIRISLGWSQERLARELGVSFSTVNRWEKGRTAPSPLAVKEIERLEKITFEKKDGNRHAIRLKAHVPIKIRLLGRDFMVSSLEGTSSFDAQTDNISRTGLMFRTRKSVSKGEKLRIGWNLGAKRMEALSEVVWINDEEPEKRIGVRFDAPMPEAIKGLMDSMPEN